MICFCLLRYTRNGDEQPMEKICMNKNELLAFLIDKPKDVQTLINEFEMNSDLREKGLLSLDGRVFIFQLLNRIFHLGFRNMLLSEQFDIINSFLSQEIYQDMTRYSKNLVIMISHFVILDPCAIIISIHLIIRINPSKIIY